MGLALLRMGMPAWLVWLCMGGAGILLVLAVLLGDMPPFAYYLITLTVGIMRPAMDDVVYTLAEWRVPPGMEAEFVTTRVEAPSPEPR